MVATTDVIYRRLRAFKDAETFERLFGEDGFEENPDWSEDLPDLGKEPLPSRESERDRGDTEPGLDDIAEMPDTDE
ncbi:hypothetical protein BRD09_00290 [Halobacteriales archaeon SW_10_68_16]|nr:MAG: hypothetical protein BRD09_00290 [Halobacteriales archaeon SW_10_68_16]